MVDPPEQDVGATVYTWCEIIRRARMNQTSKLVALIVASYANPDGTNIFPGLVRLLVDGGISFSAAQRALRTLREAGLLEVVKRGSRRRGQSDEYRLIIAEDLLDRLDLPTQDEYREAIESEREQQRQMNRQHYRHRKLHASPAASDHAVRQDSGRTFHTSPVTSEPDFHTSPEPLSHVTGDAPPNHVSPDHLTKTNPSIPIASDRDLNSQSGRATHVAAMDGTNDLDLAQTNGNHGADRRKWAAIQNRYDNGEIDDEFIVDVIGLEVGWELDTVEQRTVEGMLANGSHVKAIANKVAADRRVP